MKNDSERILSLISKYKSLLDEKQRIVKMIPNDRVEGLISAYQQFIKDLEAALNK